MSRLTNSLVSKSRKAAVPAALVASAALGALLFASQGAVHAAMNTASPLDDHSVAALTSLDQAMESVAARVTPAVVNVAVSSRGSSEQDASDSGEQTQELPPELQRFFGRMGPQGRSQGESQGQSQLQHGVSSGIIISPDGYILTNNQVVDGAVDVRVTLHDRRVMNAKVVGVDKLTDLAVLKVDAHDLPSIAWGDSSKLQPGQTVLAFGSPFGYFQFSVTRGIVSAVNRGNPYSDDARKPGEFIQTDAAINPGNSGGALVDAHGELVGINTFIISGNGSFAGAGFAIPSRIARVTAEQLIKHGKVDHGYVGVSLNDVTPDNARFFNLPDASGAIVAQVSPDSPATRAGLRTGDVIAQFNGQKVVNGSGLQVDVSETTPGTNIALGVLRNGKPMTVNVTVGQFHNRSEVASNDRGEGPQSGKLGLAVSDLTQEARQQLHVPVQVHGAVVEQVRPASPAEDAGLQSGDVILEVDRHPTSSATQFVSEVHGNPAGKDMLLLVWSKGNASYRTVRAGSMNQNG